MEKTKTTQNRASGILSASIDALPDQALGRAGTGRMAVGAGILAEPSGVGAKEEDERYIYPRFRAISKTVIPGYFFDFTRGDVLKKATSMIEGATVYPDHNTQIEKWLGVVLASQWSEGAGETPPGIDVLLRIDKVLNPKVAEGLKMNPPAIHSGSIGFNFKWEKSHPGLEDFFYKLGAEVDGKMVTIVITEITGFREFSLVYQGGDPGAKHQGFGGLQIPDHLKSVFPGFAPENQNAPSGGRKSMHSLSGEGPANSKEEAMKLSQSQAASLGLTRTGETELTQADFDKLVTDMSASLAKLQKENEDLKAMAELGEKSLTSMRQEVEKHYRLIAGETPDENVLKLIQTGPADTVQTLGATYKEVVEKLHSKTETESGSTRRSSLSAQDQESGKTKTRQSIDAYREESE